MLPRLGHTDCGLYLKVDETIWRVESPDLPAGAKVRVIAVDGATLKIEANPD